MNSSAAVEVGERRLHPVGMLLSAMTTVRRWAGISAFPGIAALVNGEFGMRTLILVLLAFVVLTLLSAVWGVLSWRATTYRISGGAFHLKRGVLQKSERSLPLEHVQSVNTVQGIVQRVFGVIELRLEAAGGGGEPEISLSALSRPAARELREELTRARRTLDEVGEPLEEPSPTVLRRLSTGELLVAGLTSGQIGVAISVVAGGSQIVDNLLPGDLAERLSEALLPRTVFAVLLLALFVALFAWVLAIFGTVLAHAGFTLSRSADGRYLHIKRGLLNRYETTVPIARIQAVRLVEGILRQPFGLAALRVESAGFGTEEGVSTVLFPLLRRREAEDFLRAAAPLFAAPLSSLEPLPARARGRYAFRSSVPALLVAAPLAFFLFPWGLLALTLVPPAALYGLVRHRAAGYALSEDRVVLRTRRLARTTVVAPRERLQSRGYSVSPIQKRRKLATLELEVASGRGGAAFRLVDLAGGAARGLVDALSARSR
ncbi:MAG: PH domain-containing protein [Actinomycetota bacterium]|nr:PH domain-containing protein [Actinomycetota bacterium]